MAFLRVVSDDGRISGGQSHQITAEETTIGRAPDNHFVVQDPSMSRYHAKIIETRKGYLLLDNDSENGVWIRDKRIAHHFLSDGDTFRTGNTIIQFSTTGLAETVHLPVAEDKHSPEKQRRAPAVPPRPVPASMPQQAASACPECGTLLNTGARFCVKCGIQLISTSEDHRLQESKGLGFFLFMLGLALVGGVLTGYFHYKPTIDQLLFGAPRPEPHLAQPAHPKSSAPDGNSEQPSLSPAVEPTGETEPSPPQPIIPVPPQESPSTPLPEMPVAQPSTVSEKPVESQSSLIHSSEGGSVVLPGGARLDIPPKTIDQDTQIILSQEELPDIPGKELLMGKVYTLSSTARPRVHGSYTLTIPYDPQQFPPGTSEKSIRLYCIYNNSMIYETNSKVDPASRKIILKNPDVLVHAKDAELQGLRRQTSSAASNRAPAERIQIGYALGKASGATMCRTGAPPETYEDPNHAFRIRFEVKSTCAFAKSVSDILQKALEEYNKSYADPKGKPPFAHLTPENRMNVYLGNYGDPEYKFYTWNGFIVLNEVKGRREDVLRQLLFHEMFHAVQDIYTNMFWAGTTFRPGKPIWWYEATAEWAGFKYVGIPYATMVETELSNYKYLLSVPIAESTGYEDGRVSYGYSLLIDHVEKQKPDYVWRVLNSSRLELSQYYLSLVQDGDLEKTYPDFVKNLMMKALPSPGIWTQGSMIERDKTTDIYDWSRLKLGDTDSNPKRLTSEADRYAVHRFSLSTGPMTSRFFHITCKGGQDPRTIHVSLSADYAHMEGSQSSDEAWLLPVQADKQRPVMRLKEQGTELTGFCKDFDTLWVGAFNSHFTGTTLYQLEIGLKRDVPPQKAAFVLKEVRAAERDDNWAKITSSEFLMKAEKDDPEQVHFRILKAPPQAISPGQTFDVEISGEAQQPRNAYGVVPRWYDAEGNHMWRFSADPNNWWIGLNSSSGSVKESGWVKFTITVPPIEGKELTLTLPFLIDFNAEVGTYDWVSFVYVSK